MVVTLTGKYSDWLIHGILPAFSLVLLSKCFCSRFSSCWCSSIELTAVLLQAESAGITKATPLCPAQSRVRRWWWNATSIFQPREHHLQDKMGGEHHSKLASYRTVESKYKLQVHSFHVNWDVYCVPGVRQSYHPSDCRQTDTALTPPKWNHLHGLPPSSPQGMYIDPIHRVSWRSLLEATHRWGNQVKGRKKNQKAYKTLQAWQISFAWRLLTRGKKKKHDIFTANLFRKGRYTAIL